MATVYLVTTGEGCDGDEWGVVGIYSTREAAERAKRAYDERRRYRPDGTYYRHTSNAVETWPLDPGADGAGASPCTCKPDHICDGNRGHNAKDCQDGCPARAKAGVSH